MKLEINGVPIETNEQDCIYDQENWTVEFTSKLANHKNINSYANHW